ncbi:hypothetical protein DF3PA_200007 [Candidatus Defluviicoccus seviourii]|uniref:Type IV secretion system coupling protein TraD DNA-binding domain-containing protein n=1 Tax=Candidatus Defluviicoccus seviourii TaxID=2565273 RepID=A0A564WCZ0_9PROT|nr:hypothetical protein DF3PA_200007 [Candidatus Defluviicoccus seviourii]
MRNRTCYTGSRGSFDGRTPYGILPYGKAMGAAMRSCLGMELGLTISNPFLKQEDGTPIVNERRFTHTHVIGKSGVGKSTALERWAIDDILNGEAIAFFDPHGHSAAEILKHVPPDRRRDVIVFDPADRRFPIGFNPLHNIARERMPFVASSLVDSFRSLWASSWGPQLEQFLYNGIAALLEVPDGTLVGLKFLLTAPAYRRQVLSHVRDPLIRDFWASDFERHMPEREQRERTLSTLNKIGALIADPSLRNIIGQPKSRLRIADIFAGKILIVSLAQGELGIRKASLIGSLLLSQIHLGALSNSRPFHLYIDECHQFGAETLVEMLSGIRKFNVSLVLAHQYLDQLSPALRSALLGTVGTTVAFRVGTSDADVLAREFGLNKEHPALEQLAPHTALSRNGGTHHLVMPQTDAPSYPKVSAIRAHSRHRYARPAGDVEARLAAFMNRLDSAPKRRPNKKLLWR